LLTDAHPYRYVQTHIKSSQNITGPAHMIVDGRGTSKSQRKWFIAWRRHKIGLVDQINGNAPYATDQ